MTLDELAARHPQAKLLAVPAWTLGCFHRRCITYATGAEDTATRVVWIQSHGLTGDIRIPARRPDLAGRASLADCSGEELATLAQAEGGVADTAWDGQRMSWSNWAAFQPYDKWPEPGVLSRVGACLIEVAPSGIYVEDWRLQPGSGGLLVGLRLAWERCDGGPERPRDGGLIVAGDHAILTLDRRTSLAAEAPAWTQTGTSAASVFESETAYARTDGSGNWRVALSTNPFREGQPLGLGAFALHDGVVVETLPDVVRGWRIDTLLPDVSVGVGTPASEAGTAWLDREADTLLR